MIQLPYDSIKLDMYSPFPGLVHIGEVNRFPLLLPNGAISFPNLHGHGNTKVTLLKQDMMYMSSFLLGCNRLSSSHWEKHPITLDKGVRDWHFDCGRETKPESEWRKEALLVASLTLDPNDSGTEVKQGEETYTCLSWHVYLMKHMYHRCISTSYKTFLRFSLTLDFEV